jgi:hypothetical protein
VQVLVFLAYELEKNLLVLAYELGKFVPILANEVKTGLHSHLRSLHSFVNTAERHVTAVRFWSGEFSVQDTFTPAPEKRPYRLINVPFYYIGQLEAILNQHLL